MQLFGTMNVCKFASTDHCPLPYVIVHKLQVPRKAIYIYLELFHRNIHKEVLIRHIFFWKRKMLQQASEPWWMHTCHLFRGSSDQQRWIIGWTWMTVACCNPAA
jgi:hypothetical protein